MSAFESGPAGTVSATASVLSGSALGLDAGGSSTKWCLLNAAGEVVGQGRTAPLTAHLLTTEAAAPALSELWQALPAVPDAIFMGLAGLGTPQQAAQMTTQLAASLAQSLPPSETPSAASSPQIRLVNDLDLAYDTHFLGGSGILVYAGTGSIAYHRTATGEVLRAGGRGYRIGDDGGAASLGRAALRWATDCLDWGQGAAGPLAQELAQVTGGLDWDTLRAFAYGTPGAANLARLAPAVSAAAMRGDGTALHLIRDAAEALAHLGRVLQRRLPGAVLPVVATGGTLQSQPLQDALNRALPGVQIIQKDHAQAAARRALDMLKS